MKKYIIILLLISSMLLTFYLSKEETTIEVNKVSKIDKVLEKPAGIQAFTLNGEKTSISFNDLISNYVLDKITCKNGTTATYNKVTNEVSLSNIKMPDYCTMNFKYTIYGKLLSDNSTIKTRSDFSETYTETTNNILFKATEKNVHNTSGATVYYFAGNPVNNWVYFAGYYWRIIRTNADGSIKLLYHGTSPSSTSAYIKTSAYNSTNNDPMYAGYKYGTSGSLANNRLNTNDSTIKSAIDSWYYSNLLNYTKYLSKEAVYCNDREVSKGYTYSTSSDFYYSFYGNAMSTPSYDCTNEYDAFSGSNMSAYLKYPISLMSYYEVRFAGGRESSNTSQAWYYYNVKNVSSTGENHWWLLTPYNWDANYKRNLISRIYYDNGGIGRLKASEEHAVRPVISLKGNLTWKSGNGTSSSPYEVEDPGTTLYSKLLADNPTIKTRTDFTTTYTETNTGTLFKSTENITGVNDEDTTVYYFAGNSTNNWVKFGGFYWRIIRTNHDGSVRLLYVGASPDSGGYIDSSCWYKDSSGNCLKAENTGYFTNDTGESEPKKILEQWYKNNLINYDKYISKEAVYCNEQDYQKFTLEYKVSKPWIRVTGFSGNANWVSKYEGEIKPSFNCLINASEYTSKYSSGGNKLLNYPIGLMTADEVSFAGGKFDGVLTSPYAYFYTNSTGIISFSSSSDKMMLMSPASTGYGGAGAIAVHKNGLIYGPNSPEIYDIRPVISLSSDVIYSSGDGSSSSPYEVVLD